MEQKHPLSLTEELLHAYYAHGSEAAIRKLANEGNLRERFLYMLRHDSLTGLYNKTAFCHEAEKLLKNNPHVRFELMVVNVNRFKALNDIFNEKIGDELLRQIASLFNALTLRPCAYGRLHADNFAILYPETGSTRRRLMTSLSVTVASFSLEYRVDLSFGIYPVADKELSVHTMCDRALMALAKAKRKNTVAYAVYDETMRQQIVEEQMLLSSMTKAIEDKDFLVYLQPKFDFVTEHIVGAEALVRWRHPHLGFISPAKFIPAFERTGAIFQVDKYVWEQVCQILRRELDAGEKAKPISVNVSRVDLYSQNLVQHFRELVKRYSIPPQLLELEITESAYVDRPQDIVRMTRELQALGFPILMDDFGSGFSSLNMLKDLPVDILKIDLNFLADTTNDTADRARNILISVVRMAKGLQTPVIVEGVESKAQAQFLRDIGCEYAQGYYYSKPVAVAAYEQMLRDYAADHQPQLRRFNCATCNQDCTHCAMLANSQAAPHARAH